MDRKRPDFALRSLGGLPAHTPRLGEKPGFGGLTRAKRWRLWDLHRGIHGALLALSFNEDDLRRLLRKAKVSVPEGARYYDIHRHFCEACVSRTPLSEVVERQLEQKFAGKVIALRGVRDAESLRARWQEAWGKGRGLAAVFWAFLAHPVATDELRAEFYADVHALFFKALHEREKFMTDIDAHAHKLRALEKRKREETAALQRRIESLLQKPAAPAGEASLGAATQDLRRRLELAELRASKAEARVRTLEQRLALLREDVREAERLRAAAPCPVADVAQSSQPGLATARDAPALQPNVTPITRLPGVRIAYVGGRPGVVERIQQFCEMRGAVFVHHDGGIEQSPARLDAVLTSCDVVFYPIDCVSHEALIHVKAHSRRSNTPAIPLRNASMSSFRAAVRAWVGLA